MSNQKNLWGGRFSGKADPEFADFNNSFKFDSRLFEADVNGKSGVIATPSREPGVFSDDEAQLIQSGLDEILKRGTSNDRIVLQLERRRYSLIC